MTQQEELSETFVQKSEEFFAVLVKIYGKSRAVVISHDLLYYGKDTAEKIRQVGMETVYFRAGVQAKILVPTELRRTRLSCPTLVVKFERLSVLWKELYDLGASRVNTAHMVQNVIHDQVRSRR